MPGAKFCGPRPDQRMKHVSQQLITKLKSSAGRLAESRIAALFSTEPERVSRFCVSAAGLRLDLSKQMIDQGTLDDLLQLADDSAVATGIAAMFAGETINNTEARPALHTALRMAVAGHDEVPHANVIRETHVAMEKFVTAVHAGERRGFSGKAFTDVVNIGIGGSHLGPQLACDALRYEADRKLNAHFLANVDGGEFERVLQDLNPETTLFVVASKSFSTVETRLNANSARQWLLAASGNEASVERHFVAVSANTTRAAEFGINPGDIFPMWDWVGGRYSMWSAIGLPIALAYGMRTFDDLLRGAAAMDVHFAETEAALNLPVLMALTGVWNTNFLGADSYAVVPYDDRLRFLPEYLQQLEMESNGKSTAATGSAVNSATAPITWGGLGTNAQHAFFQLLHQGTRLVPLDLIVSLTHPVARQEHHDLLVANCFAQAEGLMTGRKVEADADAHLAAHRSTPGNRPSSMLTVEALTAATLGALIALYEHKTYVQSLIWEINAFDQWGVELGKALATTIMSELTNDQGDGQHDPSTSALIESYRQLRSESGNR